MPNKVTFDGPNKVIVEIAAGPENTVDVTTVYSEWKTWLRQSDNAKYLPAFSQVGGDPITTTQNLGSTFFLENGWRIRPAESNHKVTLVGNVYTREPGQSVFVPTEGAFTVNTETRVSSLVDSTVSRLDVTALLNAVYIDTEMGVPGTGEGVGTPTNPVSNISDALSIAQRMKIRRFHVSGVITLQTSLHGYQFHGSSGYGNTVDTNGQDVDGATFSGVTVRGALTGRITAEDCALEISSGYSGVFRACSLNVNFSLIQNSSSTFVNCYSGIAGDVSPVMVFESNTMVGFRNYAGGVTVANITDGCIASFDLDPGKITLLSSCIGGECLVRGTGVIVNDAAGTTVIDGGFLRADRLTDVWENQGDSVADKVIAHVWAASG